MSTEQGWVILGYTEDGRVSHDAVTWDPPGAPPQIDADADAVVGPVRTYWAPVGQPPDPEADTAG